MDLNTIDIKNKDDREKIFALIAQDLMKNDFIGLKKQSNRLLEFGLLKKSKEIVYVSCFAYVLYKTLTQPHIVKQRDWNMNKEQLLKRLDFIAKQELSEYIEIINKSYEEFKEREGELSRYIKNILNKAKIKQAAKLYSLGVSLKTAIMYTDADIIELQHYLHTSKEHDIIHFEETLSKKVKMLMNLIN